MVGISSALVQCFINKNINVALDNRRRGRGHSDSAADGPESKGSGWRLADYERPGLMINDRTHFRRRQIQILQNVRYINYSKLFKLWPIGGH